jgi:MFS family permease
MTETTLRCANHPGRETMLRCNKCDKPICAQCAVRTPVGYRCRECVNQQQTIYFNNQPADPFIAVGVAGTLGVLLGVPIYLFLGIFGLFSLIAAIFVGPAVGGLVAEAVRRSVGKRRGRYQKYIVSGAWIIGLLAAGVLLVVLGALAPVRLFRLDVLLAAVLAVSAITARLW